VRELIPDEPDPGLRGLWLGLLAYRWGSLAWMTGQVLIAVRLRLPAVAAISIGGLILWNVYFTATRAWERSWARWADLAISLGVIAVSGLVMERGDIAGDHPFFATAYPVSSVMTVAAGDGLVAGIGAGVGLAVALAISRPLNGVALGSLTAGQAASLVNGAVYYVAAGLAIGLFSRVLATSRREVRAARELAIRERERAARAAERERIGRQIHDSVLQTLSMIVKRGTELSRHGPVPADEVRDLTELAQQQERELRDLLRHGPDEEAPAGSVAVRTILQAATYGIDGVPVAITTVDPLWFPSDRADELTAAIRQALDNAARHARASRVTLFAERDGDAVVIAIRDDGVGFRLDEGRLREEGRIGFLGSIKGRIEDMGGRVRLDSEPGHGTEVELRVPVGSELT
jgi:signal transduction histidine kinase